MSRKEWVHPMPARSSCSLSTGNKHRVRQGFNPVDFMKIWMVKEFYVIKSNYL
jgi:hypothetical protein